MMFVMIMTPMMLSVGLITPSTLQVFVGLHPTATRSESSLQVALLLLCLMLDHINPETKPQLSLVGKIWECMEIPSS